MSDILYFSHSFRRGPSVFSFSFSFSYKSILILESCFFDEAVIQLQEYSPFRKAVFRRGHLFFYSLFHSATRVFSLLESRFSARPSVFIFSFLFSHKSILPFKKFFFRRGHLFLYSLCHPTTRVLSILESSFFDEAICFNIFFFVKLQ